MIAFKCGKGKARAENKENQMSKATITLVDRYQDNLTCKLRVEAVELDDQSAQAYRPATHYAKLTSGQYAKIKRELPNGCSAVDETKIDNCGKVTECEVIFDMDTADRIGAR